MEFEEVVIKEKKEVTKKKDGKVETLSTSPKVVEEEVFKIDVIYRKKKKYILKIFSGKKMKYCKRHSPDPNGQNEKPIFYNQISSVNLVSKLNSAKKKPIQYGVHIGVVRTDLKNSPFKTYEFIIDEKSANSDNIQNLEKRLVILLQQFSFFGNFDMENVFKCSLLNKSDRRMIIFLNPKSGKKMGKKMFNKNVVPIIDLAHFSFDVLITEKREHALEFCKNFDYQKYNEIGIVGGDGTLWEAYNGLLNHKSVHYEEAMKIPISIFPAGTGNAVAFACGSDQRITNSALYASRGKYTKMDIYSAFTDNKRVYGMLFSTFAGVADANTMFPRSLGELAFFLGALGCIFRRIYYKFEIKIVLEKGTDEKTIFKKKEKEEFYNIWKDKIKFDLKRKQEVLDCPFTRNFFMKELKEVGEKFVDVIGNVKESEEQKEEIKSYKMISLNEGLVVCHISNFKKMSNNIWSTPNQTFGSGSLDFICCSEQLTVKEFLSYLANMMHPKPDKHLNGKVWKGWRIKCAYIKPLMVTKAWNLDGETQKYVSSILEVHKGLGRIMHL